MKRKSGLQKKISSIFKNCPVDELSSDAPLPPSGQEQAATPHDDSIELTLESKSLPIVDPPDFTLETPDTLNQDHTALQENAQAESEQHDKVRKITDDGLSYFSFTCAEQAREDSTADDILEEDHAEEPEQTIHPASPTPLHATLPGHEIDKRKVLRVSMVGILSVVFVFALLWALAPSLFEEKPPIAIDSTDLTPLAMIQARSLSQVWPKPQSYRSDLRDPMVPMVSEKTIRVPVHGDHEELNPKLDLVGIVFSEDKPSVIIGKEILFVGDEIEGITIISISKTEVVFEEKSKHKQWTQSL